MIKDIEQEIVNLLKDANIKASAFLGERVRVLSQPWQEGVYVVYAGARTSEFEDTAKRQILYISFDIIIVSSLLKDSKRLTMYDMLDAVREALQGKKVGEFPVRLVKEEPVLMTKEGQYVFVATYEVRKIVGG